MRPDAFLLSKQRVTSTKLISFLKIRSVVVNSEKKKSSSAILSTNKLFIKQLTKSINKHLYKYKNYAEIYK